MAAIRGTDLGALESVQLMRRFDTKYVVPDHWVPGLLDALAPHVHILEVEGQRESEYGNLYFELPGDRFLQDHLRGKARRMKVRRRQYASNGQAFLEVKERLPGGRTVKERVACPADFEGPWTGETQELLARHLVLPEQLEPRLCGQFRRLTLVDFDRRERLTIDREIRAGLHGEALESLLPGLAVIEVKQTRTDHHSPVQLWLREHRGQGILARQTRMSKYAIGRLQCEPELTARTYLATQRRLREAISRAGDLEA